MKTWFRNNMTGRYLLTEAPEGYEFEYGMIASITDGHILRPLTVYEEGKKCLAYDVSGLESLEECFGRRWISATDIGGLMLQIVRMMEKLQEYLLADGNLMIGRNCIFFDPHRNQLCFPVHPAADPDALQALSGMLGFLVMRADRKDVSALSLAAELYRRAEEADFCLGMLPQLLRDHIGGEESPAEKISGVWEEDFFEQGDIPEGKMLSEETADREAVMTDSDVLKPMRRSRKREPKRLNLGSEGLLAQPAQKTMILRLIASQLIMLTGLMAVFMLRGWYALKHALPVYLILSVSIALYFVIDMIVEKRRDRRSSLSKKTSV